MQLDFIHMSRPVLVLTVLVMLIIITPIVTFILLEISFFINFIIEKVKENKI